MSLVLVGAVAFLTGAAPLLSRTPANRSGLPIQQVADQTGYIDPNTTYRSNIVTPDPIQTTIGTVTWLPDTPGSQNGTLTGGVHTGINKGIITGSYMLMSINDGPWTSVKVNDDGNHQWWEVPNVKADDKVEFKQVVTYASLSASSLSKQT